MLLNQLVQEIITSKLTPKEKSLNNLLNLLGFPLTDIDVNKYHTSINERDTYVCVPWLWSIITL